LDNSKLVINNYAPNGVIPGLKYTGCTICGTNGSPTGGACGLPADLAQFQPVASDTIYVPTVNQVWSVSTGAVDWASGDPDVLLNSPIAAVAGSHVVFISGTNVLVQSY
jgi:hypothetical protein